MARNGHHPEAVAAPTPAAPLSSTSLRRAGLQTQVEVHDSTQLEVRFNYAVGSETGPERYQVDTYFFVPRNVGLNRTNFTREQFYADVTSLMRLDAAALHLDELADERNPASPLCRISATLHEFGTSPRPPPSRPAIIQVKLYAYLFTLGVREELSRLQKKLKECTADSAKRPAFESAVDDTLVRIGRALNAYRKVRSRFWPFEQLAPAAFAEAMRTADEYMSLYLEERLTLFAQTLEKDPARLDGSAFVPRVRVKLSELARVESTYRAHYGYLTLTEDLLSEGEYFTYRASILKKSIQQALYLDTREVKQDTFLRNAVGAVGAALAAIWALATQLPATLAEVSGTTKMLFFISAVIAYVAKDRIKALTNEWLTRRLRAFDHTSWLHGDSLAAIGLGMLQARVRESMRFLTSDDVPAEILAQRVNRRTVRHAEVMAEEVIHYSKQLDVGSREEHERLPEGFWVRDLLRLNVRHFLVRLDDPLDRVQFFDHTRDRFCEAELPKVYHLNVVLRVARQNPSGLGQYRLEHLRVVLDKRGIVRVEEVGSDGPHAIASEPKGLRLPFRNRRPTAPRKP